MFRALQRRFKRRKVAERIRAKLREQEFYALERSFVRLHLKLGIREEEIPEVTEMSEDEMEVYLQGIHRRYRG